MSSNLQLYTSATIRIDGKSLTESSSISINRASNAKESNTTQKGFAGMTAGAANLEISVDNAVPSLDFELNPSAFMFENRVVEFIITAAGRTLITYGFIVSDSFSQSVDSSTKLTFTAKCQYASWL